MRLCRRTLHAITAGGVSVFLLILILLHLVQPGYDPLNQLMSELALGKSGEFLVLAFVGLATATAALAASLHLHRAPVSLTVLLGIAATCFLGAGLITLATSVETHVGLVAAAFVLVGMTMYLLPLKVSAFSSPAYRIASWGACVVMAAATAAGGDLMLPGIAQRLSAMALLSWLCLAAWRLRR